MLISYCQKEPPYFLYSCSTIHSTQLPSCGLRRLPQFLLMLLQAKRQAIQDKTTPLEGCHEAGLANCALCLHLLISEKTTGIFLAVKWLTLHTSTARGTGQFLVGKVLHAMQCCKQKKKKKKNKKKYIYNLIFILFPETLSLYIRSIIFLDLSYRWSCHTNDNMFLYSIFSYLSIQSKTSSSTVLNRVMRVDNFSIS